MTRFALFQGDRQISGPFITRESLSFFIKQRRKDLLMEDEDTGITVLRSDCYIKKIADDAPDMYDRSRRH